jgi:hypothetical protein
MRTHPSSTLVAFGSLLLALVSHTTAAVLGQVTAPQTGPSATQAPTPDVVGLRLGMTQEQAIAALRAYNPAVRVRAIADTLPPPAGTRYTRTLYAGVFGDDRTGIGDETFRIELSNPLPTPRVIVVWRHQTYPAGRELSVANIVAAFRDKYGPPRFTRTAARLTNWTWATGTGAQQPTDHAACIVHQQATMGTSISLVTSAFVEPRIYFHDSQCGTVLDMVVSGTGPLAASTVTALTDFPGGVRTRLEVEEMSQRPDTRPAEADARGRPAL